MKKAMPLDWVVEGSELAKSSMSMPGLNACCSARTTGTWLTGLPRWSFTSTCRGMVSVCY